MVCDALFVSTQSLSLRQSSYGVSVNNIVNL